MINVLAIVFPAFGLIALGFAAARWQLFSTTAHRGLSEFAFNFAIPAMLFRKMATADLSETVPLNLWASYFGAVAITWGIATVVAWRVLRRPFPDSASISMTASFGNTVMLGIPLAVARYGEAALAPIALILSIHAPLLWFTATLHLAMSDRENQPGLSQMFVKLLLDMAKNPIIMALVAGSLWRLTEFGLAQPIDKILVILGQASVATALFALGLGLQNLEIKGQAATVSAILILKMLVMPAVAWVLAVQVFALPSVSAGVVVLLAACPTGVNAFLFASRSNRAVNSSSGAIALGIPLAAFTMTLLLYLLDRVG